MTVQDVLNLSLYGETEGFKAPDQTVLDWAEELENEIFYWFKFRAWEGQL